MPPTKVFHQQSRQMPLSVYVAVCTSSSMPRAGGCRQDLAILPLHEDSPLPACSANPEVDAYAVLLSVIITIVSGCCPTLPTALFMARKTSERTSSGDEWF